MNLEGLTEKMNRKGTVYYENTGGEIVVKVCSNCGGDKAMKDYAKDKKCLGGRRSMCKSCMAEKDLKYREENKEYQVEYKRNWRELNKEHNANNKRNWRLSNPEKRSLSQQRRRARKAKLEDTLTTAKYAITLEHFGNACAVTGRTENLEQEHAIPLSIGHGGTTFENCYPMVNGLNQSKYNHNIFEWFEANRQRFELSQERFDKLITWLASANAMTTEEYRDYVYWCHANPRSDDENANANDDISRQAI